MKALTLTQPWAGLVASGIKLVENRSRSIIKRDAIGKRFAIHASRQYDTDSEVGIWHIDRSLFDDQVPNVRWSRLAGVASAVIAVATLERAVIEWHSGDVVDAHGVNGLPVVELGDQRKWFFGPIGYVLRDVIALRAAVPCRGWQGFWTLPADVERAVTEQL